MNQWIALPHHEGPQSDVLFCVEFACSPRVCVGFLQVPPTIEKRALQLIGDWKLSLGMSHSVCVRVWPAVTLFGYKVGKIIDGGFMKLSALVGVMPLLKEPSSLLIVRKVHSNSWNRGGVVVRAGKILLCGSISISCSRKKSKRKKRSAGMRSEADWNTTQDCRIQLFHLHKFLRSLCLATKRQPPEGGEEDNRDIILNIIIKQNARTCFLGRHFSSQTSSPTVLASLIVFLQAEAINVSKQ